MKSIRGRAGLALAAVMLLLAGCGGDRPSPPEDRETASPRTSPNPRAGSPDGTGRQRSPEERDGSPITIEVRDEDVRGPDVVEVGVGEQVDFVVRSDTQDEVHVHGYDKTAAVGPGRDARLTFTADIPGVFEVELESSGLKLFELSVS